MFLENLKTCCSKYQKIIVSEENGMQHRVNNSITPCKVRHYHLDVNKNIFKEGKCCDYLLLNDTKKDAYFIELEGINIDKAVKQLEATIDTLKNEIPKYTHLLRIVHSRAKTHKIHGNTFRIAQAKYGKRLRYKEMTLEEDLRN